MMTEENNAPAPAEAPASDSLISNDPAPAALDFSQGRPQDFPEDFWDGEKNAPKVEELYKQFQNRDKIAKDLRVKLSKGEFISNAPADIAEYTLELDDKLKAIAPDDDPILLAAKQAAKDAGLPKEAFSKFMMPILAKLAETNAELAPQEPTPEEKQLAREEEIAKLGAGGHKVVSAVGAYIDQLHAGGTFSDQEAKTAKEMAFSADAVRVLNKLRMLSGGQDQVPLDLPIDDRASKADIEVKLGAAMMSGNEAEYNKLSAMLAKYN